jgi:hypothetical protein
LRSLVIKNTLGSRRSGFAIFIALGAIVVLSMLIFSYNLLVRGKFNERQNILNHTRALKAAQGTARYIFARLKHDLSDMESASQIREAFIQNNTSLLNAYLNEIEYQNIFEDICGPSLLTQTIEAKLELDKPVFLGDLAKGSEVYLKDERGGYVKLKLVAKIDKNVEEWEEIRPYRIALPFPIGLTKFTLYLKKPTTQGVYGFNKIEVTEAQGGGFKEQGPLIVDNGSSISDNKDPNVWKVRGWIYLGGGQYHLNRANGNTAYGQQYHSYIPDEEMPKAIPEILDGIYNDKTGFLEISGMSMHLRSARWGFSPATTGDSWEHVLNNPSLFNMDMKVKSTWLHLFGDINCTQNFKSSGYRPEHRVPSITRVVGHVYDRYLKLSYLSTCEDPSEAIAAFRYHDKYTFENIIQQNAKPEMELIFTSNQANVDYFAEPDNDLTELRDFFKNMGYDDDASTDLTYRKLTCRDGISPYNEIYTSIVQYTRDERMDTPPSSIHAGELPPMSEMDFGLGINDIHKKLPPINNLAETIDNKYGLTNRITYEITHDEFKKLFYKGSKYNLQNAVVHLKGTQPVTLDGLTIESGGTVVCDSDITVGEMQKASADLQPLLFVSLNGSITVSGHTEAYLMALSEAGEIKTTNSTLDVFGGIAANSLDQAQGFLTYNPNFDPVNEGFKKHLGVVLGPEGKKR